MRAGDLAFGGAIAIAIRVLIEEGAGQAGQELAAARLLELFPETAANSIQAIIDLAVESVQIGYGYNRGGPGYTPAHRRIPDARRIERESENPLAGTPGNRPEPEFIHEGVIEIYDPRWPEEPIQRIPVTIRDPDLLTKEELDQLLLEQADTFISALVASAPGRFDPEELSIRFRHGGVWIGY